MVIIIIINYFGIAPRYEKQTSRFMDGRIRILTVLHDYNYHQIYNTDVYRGLSIHHKSTTVLILSNTVRHYIQRFFFVVVKAGVHIIVTLRRAAEFMSLSGLFPPTPY